MALIYVGETIPVLTLERELFEGKYWNQGLSPFIANKYGHGTISDREEVDMVLMDCFEYFVDKFETLVRQQDTEMFFRCVFELCDASIELAYRNLSKSIQLPDSIIDHFTVYRRVLMLIFEQACDIELTAKKHVDLTEALDVIQELYYLGFRCYDFAMQLATHKMTPNIFYTEFVNGIFILSHHIHLDEINRFLLKAELDADYKAFYNPSVFDELKKTIKDRFFIDFDEAIQLVHFLVRSSSDHTIKPSVLPIHLANVCGTSRDRASTFYSGLTISRKNKQCIKNTILKPLSGKRYFYRPILIAVVDGVEKAFVGEYKVLESIRALETNGVHWKEDVPDEWLEDEGVHNFVQKKRDAHSRLLEDEIERIFVGSGCPYCRNVESFRQKGKNNVNIGQQKGVGEIDFIIVNKDRQKVFIAETKYCRTRCDPIAFRADYTNFKDRYEPQLSNKETWLRSNLKILQEDLELTFQINYSILDFDLEAVFFINTPTFYMFDGKYKAVTLNRIKDFIEGSWDFPDITINDDENNRIFTYSHPYFSKPPVITRQG
ncbi:MAG: hypothetical protein LBR10_03965 [Prevotellaceae bacterium]|nr:hypothetical protein [Prevotellaceae bacterium]